MMDTQKNLVHVVSPRDHRNEFARNEPLARELRELGQQVRFYTTTDSLLHQYDGQTSNCIILDANSVDEWATSALAQIQEADKFAQVVLLVTFWRVSDVVAAIKSGFTDVLCRPIDPAQIRRILVGSLGRRHPQQNHLRSKLPMAMLKQLTDEELRLCAALLNGRTIKQIGVDFDLSIRTIHYRKKAMLQKLGLPNWNSAVEMVREFRSFHAREPAELFT